MFSVNLNFKQKNWILEIKNIKYLKVKRVHIYKKKALLVHNNFKVNLDAYINSYIHEYYNLLHINIFRMYRDYYRKKTLASYV